MSQRGIEASGGALFSDPGQDGLLHRAFLRGAGFSRDDVRRRPVIGIANSASDLNPCNLGHARLVDEVRAGVREAGGLPLVFPTISVSEPFTRPTSLYLRNLMSMDVEEMISTAPIDGVVLLGGCDKTIPAQLMGAISAGKPAVVLAAGPRPISCHAGRSDFTIDDVWPICAARAAGEVGDDEWERLEGDVNVGVGTCNVVGTATTMAAVAEVLGFALPGSSLADASSPERRAWARRTGAAAVAAVQRGDVPRSRITLRALENAFRLVTAIGGSANSVIHLEAIAGRAGLRIGLERFDRWSRETPHVANVRPGGTATLPEFERAGGIPGVLQRIRELIDLDVPTATGGTWREVLDAAAPPDPRVIVAADAARTPGGSLRVLRGTLAPRGAVIRLSGVADARLLRHRGRAVVFDGIDDLNARIDDPDLEVDEASVLVLRGLGPIGAPGMPEVGHLPIPAKLRRQGVRDMVRISDARMSGTSIGAVVLHVAPEAAVGGPLALVRDGDEVLLDAEAGRLDVLVPPEELAARASSRAEPASPARGYARLHAEHVLQADEGCDFDFLRDPALAASPTSSGEPREAVAR